MELKTVTVIAESSFAFFEKYNEYIKQGYRPADPGIFDMEIRMSAQTNYWKVGLQFNPQVFVIQGLENLAWEDLKALAGGMGLTITSKPATLKVIEKALGIEEPEPKSKKVSKPKSKKVSKPENKKTSEPKKQEPVVEEETEGEASEDNEDF